MGSSHGVQSYQKAKSRKTDRRRDWSPVGVVVPLDEGNAGGREKSMWQ